VGVVSMIEAARAAGKLGAFGVSCYSPEIALAALQHPVVSALQVPANVFDRRFLSDDVLRALKARGGFLFVRSVFLQGLGLMAPEQAPRHVPQAFEAVTALSTFCAEIAMTPQAFCLHYLNHRLRDTAHSLIVGVEKAAQLNELLAAMQTPAPTADAFAEWDKRWPQSPIELVNPALWKRS
jgi:aryl-alcohol dehydrogenase-like predicted oxidoreductase